MKLLFVGIAPTRFDLMQAFSPLCKSGARLRRWVALARLDMTDTVSYVNLTDLVSEVATRGPWQLSDVDLVICMGTKVYIHLRYISRAVKFYHPSGRNRALNGKTDEEIAQELRQRIGYLC